MPASSPVELSVTPVGKVPLVLKLGAGKPVALNWNGVAAVPAWKPTALALVMFGASFTVSVKVCVPALPTPLLTLRLMV